MDLLPVTMALRTACATPGCTGYSTGSTYCAVCQTREDRSRNRRKNRRRRARLSTGDGAASRLRRRINTLGMWRCAQCQAHWYAKDLTVDHVAPLVDGGLDVDDNVQALCPRCNRDKTGREARQRKATP